LLLLPQRFFSVLRRKSFVALNSNAWHLPVAIAS
jgi:hypothetical protein